ncbi:hypothetical protein NE237_001011 [Protea cynaroides]|uniref:Uncharacterized protein n=1 Tax=Protea cynaroides TaxID=273540 RepID=A0A9Q0KSJ1_9MAGN|nr:hypothetical protein NE237_001011 [Protea cynaroides]
MAQRHTVVVYLNKLVMRHSSSNLDMYSMSRGCRIPRAISSATPMSPTAVSSFITSRRVQEENIYKSIQTSNNGVKVPRTFSGTSEGMDIIVSSTLAYVSALNHVMGFKNAMRTQVARETQLYS